MALTNKLTAIADAIRAKTGGTDLLSLDGMASTVNGMVLGDGAEIQAMFDAVLEKTATEVIITAKRIEGKAFYEMSSLVNAIMPEELTTLGNNAFYYCENLELTALPSGLTYIGDSAFYKCKKLELTTLPSGLTHIGGSAFVNCSKLKTMEIPSGVTNVGIQAFQNCTNLASVTFKGTPSTMGTNIFVSCVNLKEINVPWAEGSGPSGAPWGATNATINYNYTGE